MEQEQILILDFGGQYKQLIARRIRECSVYCEILPHTTPIEALIERHPKGIVLTGGPDSVNEPDAPTYTADLFRLGVPILGICYGAQWMAKTLGGAVEKASVSEYGHANLWIDATDSMLLRGVPAQTSCWMSHTDRITSVPEGFCITAHTEHCPVAAMEDAKRQLYGVQFHPEVVHTPDGATMLHRFVREICGCKGNWRMSAFAHTQIDALRNQIGTSRVLLGLSGGVDSAVAAALLSKAIGKQLVCVFVDHGLLRKDEGDEVEAVFGQGGGFELRFVRVFEEEARKLGAIDYLAQGTIYPDVIESGVGGAVIKSHHNVGGLPKNVSFRGIIEPLRPLFKDEVRAVGLELGLPASMVYRQPFPGPGLGVRIVGEITPEKVRIVQEADAIFREELTRASIDVSKGQFFAALTNLQSVGVMGDARTYASAVVLRAVMTDDFMTARAARLPYELLDTTMNRIINEVKGVNRVFYDLTSKPPATIELE